MTEEQDTSFVENSSPTGPGMNQVSGPTTHDIVSSTAENHPHTVGPNVTTSVPSASVTTTSSAPEDLETDASDESEGLQYLEGHTIGDSYLDGTVHHTDATILDIRRAVTGSWRLPVTVGKKKVFGIFDSGSQATVIRPDMMKHVPEKYRQIRPSAIKIIGIHEDISGIDGEARIPMKVGSKVYLVDVCVAPLKDSVLLGMNFIDQLQAKVDFHSGNVTIGTEEVYMQREHQHVSAAKLTVRRATVVAARSEQLIELKSQVRTLKHGVPMLIQPVRAFSTNTGLVMARSLSGETDGYLTTVVANITDEPIVIHNNSTIALATPVDTILGAVNTETRDDESSVVMDDPDIIRDAPEYLHDMINRCELKIHQKIACASLITEYQDCFMGPNGPLGRTSEIKHTIDTGEHSPIKQRHRRIPQMQIPIVEQEVNKMLELNVIEPSSSPWSSPTVLVRKKNGDVRFCVDYRQVNAVTRKDSYPLPNIQETFDTLAGAKYFSSLDFASGYWQVEVDPKDRPKTAFATREGLFQFKTMPFGLCNAPATFERLMETVLRGYLWQRCMCYLDDVIIYGTSFEIAHDNLRAVLERIRQSGLKLQPKKCDLFRKELLYLGFIISGEGVKPDPEKLRAIRNWPVPCNITDIRSFLGFCNYHRRFVPQYAEIAEPLVALTRGSQTFRWGTAQRRAFRTLKDALIAAPRLSHPEPSDDHLFVLDTDASAFAVGGALSQRINGVEHPLGFASKTLSRTQRNYCTTYRELLAVVEMIQHFRHYLWGRNFLLRTDHSSLRWLKNYNDADGMLARWLAKLQQYDFTIEHRAGKEHGNADGLSRCHSCKNDDCQGRLRVPTTEEETSTGEFPIKRTVVVRRAKIECVYRQRSRKHRRHRQRQDRAGILETSLTVPDRKLKGYSVREIHAVRSLDTQIDQQNWLSDFTNDDLRVAQQQDASLGQVYEWVEKREKPTPRELSTYDEETKTLVSRWKYLVIKNGILVRAVSEIGTGRGVFQTVLPGTLRERILHHMHDLRVVGHMGIQRTIARVKQRFYWPGLALDVARWCAKCPECASRKGKPPPSRVPLTQLPTGAPFDRIAMDILDTHKPTSKGHRYVLVIADYFSKYTDAFPLRRHTAKAVADTLMTRWIVYHGVPKAIHTDQGTEFESNLMHRLVQLLGARKTRTSPYRPQSDGLVERFNRTLLNMLSAFVSERGNDWDVHLPYVLMAYRTSVHSSTGCTPQIMIYGRESNLPVDLVFPHQDDPIEIPCGIEYVDFIRNAIKTTHEYAREHLRKSAIRQKRGYDAHAKHRPEFAVGEHVRYYYRPLTAGNKFARPWTGPWTILRQLTEVDYKIGKVSNPHKQRVVHIDNLKPYEGDIDDPTFTMSSTDSESIPDVGTTRSVEKEDGKTSSEPAESESSRSSEPSRQARRKKRVRKQTDKTTRPRSRTKSRTRTDDVTRRYHPWSITEPPHSDNESQKDSSDNENQTLPRRTRRKTRRPARYRTSNS